jgi:mono/diheme cytochrome c family protein
MIPLRQLFARSTKSSQLGSATRCEVVALPCRRKLRTTQWLAANPIISNCSNRTEGHSPKNYGATRRQGIAAASQRAAKPIRKKSMARTDSRVGLFIVLSYVMLLLTGCSARLPGQPSEAERWRAPAEINDFNQLYTQNCAGCHGVDGKLAAARSLNDPLYLAFIPDDAMRQVISRGSAGTSMPAFSEKAGGHLTDHQIELLVTGMRSHWSKPDEFKGVELPRYSVEETAATTGPSALGTNVKSSETADATRGAATYKTYCESCHGTNGEGGSAGSIVDPNFLNLVSDQGLRTTVVVGRADIGKPDWRSNVPGRPMSAQEIADVVAWLAAQRQGTNVAVNKR